MSRSLCIYLHSAAYDRIYQAMNLAHAAASMGRSVHVFLLYGALASYVAGTWDDAQTTGEGGKAARAYEGMAQRFEMLDTPSLYDILQQARGTERVRVYGCSASARFAGIEPGELLPRVDEIVGLATMLELSEDAQTVYI